MHKSFACEKGLCIIIGYENVMHVGKEKKRGCALLLGGIYYQIRKNRLSYLMCVLCMFDKYIHVKKIH
jgi:hypothetical protein